MGVNNAERVIVQSNAYIANINRLFKDIKSQISADFIFSDKNSLVVITNKITTYFDLKIVEKYMKELNDINLNDIMSLRLPQSKSYLKTLGIPYFINNTNIVITFSLA